MAIDIKEYMKITGLTKGAAKAALARGDEYAEWHMPSGAAKIAARKLMEAELEADETNAGTIVVETTPTAAPTAAPTSTPEAGAGEGEDEGDGNDLDGEGDGEITEE